MNCTQRIDNCIQLIKWPSAWLAALLTPLLLWGLLKLVARVFFDPVPIVPFILGTIAFAIVWRRWLGKSSLGKFLITLEHESTHAIFAMLTWHRIVGFRTSVKRGGEVRFLGRGNWLITVAPYFFPTAALLLFLAAFFLPFPGLPWPSFLLGVALGYHFASTYRETHRDQTDIQILGLTFCWLFLPAANIAVIGLLISFAHGGPEGLALWFNSLSEPFRQAIDWISAVGTGVPTEGEPPA